MAACSKEATDAEQLERLDLGAGLDDTGSALTPSSTLLFNLDAERTNPASLLCGLLGERAGAALGHVGILDGELPSEVDRSVPSCTDLREAHPPLLPLPRRGPILRATTRGPERAFLSEARQRASL